MKNHHRIVIANISLGVIALGALFLFYQAFLDGTVINPVVVHNMPTYSESDVLQTGTFSPIGSTVVGSYKVQTEKTSYKLGDGIFGYFSLCSYTRLVPIVQWTFVNDIAQATSPRSGTLIVPGCYKNIKVFMATVPLEFKDSSPGSKYRLYGEVTFAVNPIRKISYMFVSNSFSVSNQKVAN